MPRRLLAVRQGLSDRRALRSVHYEPRRLRVGAYDVERLDLTTEPLRAKMGRWAYGCDVCQDVCPFNRGAWSGGEEFPGLSELAKYLPLTEIVEADYDTLKNIVQPAFWYIPADKVWRYKTNALNVMLNDYSPEYLPAIKKPAPTKRSRCAKWRRGCSRS